MGKFRAVGFDTYLVRPVRPQALLALFDLGTQDVVTQPLATAAQSSASQRQSGSAAGPRILLAEDNDINALLARRMLEKSGCEVIHVGDGEQAVAAVAAALDGTGPSIDLVLMDVHMPKLDGIEAVRTLHAMVAGRCAGELGLPPIIALTANAFAEDRQRCLAAGLDDYLAKPFEKEELASLLQRWLPGKGRGRAA